LEREAELEWIRRFLRHLEAGTTELAPSASRRSSEIFTSPEHCERERDRVFLRQPVVVGLSCELSSPGDFFTISVAGVPVVVIRDRDGLVGAFVNLCRHRGGPVAQGRGRADGGHLRCPFHSWTYTTAGELAAIPHAEDAFGSIDRAEWGLRRLACVESAGVILVRVKGEGPLDARAALRGVGADFEAIDLPSYHHFETRSTSWGCNWKLLLATFLESYHVFSLHRESVDPWYFSHPMVHDAWDGNLRFPVARRTLAELTTREESEWRLADHATIQWLVSPHALVSYTRDYLLLWRFHSPQPNRTEIVTSLYSAAPFDSESAHKRLEKAFDGQMRIAGAEDFPLQEEIQRGLDSGALPEVIFGRNEMAALSFLEGLDRVMASVEEATDDRA
jgi:phenylpropionate dioxygenase-like ring-hydroxylating dioxygenase large terminal subunit